MAKKYAGVCLGTKLSLHLLGNFAASRAGGLDDRFAADLKLDIPVFGVATAKNGHENSKLVFVVMSPPPIVMTTIVPTTF